MVRQVKQQIDNQLRPIISVNIETRHQTVFSLRFKNNGASAAENVRFILDTEFYQFAEFDPARNIQTFHIFKEIIPNIAPDDGFLIDLCQGFNINNKSNEINIAPDRFIIEVKYKWSDKEFCEAHKIDLRPYFQTFSGEREVEELININKTLKKIDKHLSRLK